jgi:crotonobetainyl-CoA:carnitine CoA-transferase CaiB-like acyl-CoA transferase
MVNTTFTDATGSRHGPLKDIRVIDFTGVLGGSFCTAIMADLDAKTIKAEGVHGDNDRHIPHFKEHESAFFVNESR